MRYIRLREGNPTAEIAFVYSARLLNEKALAQLHSFCEKYRIRPVDYDTEVEALITHESDNEIYQLSQIELSLIHNEGGNLAAAADFARALVPLAQHFGTYLDYDVACHLGSLPEYVSIHAPVLFSAGIKRVRYPVGIVDPNSDMVAYARDDVDPTKLHVHAVRAIRFLQSQMYANHNTPFCLEVMFAKRDIEMGVVDQGVRKIFEDFKKVCPDYPTVYDFRKYLDHLKDIPGLSAKEFSAFKSICYAFSVICMSGPGNYHHLFRDLMPDNIEQFPTFLLLTDPAWQTYLTMYKRADIGSYEHLFKLVVMKNRMENTTAGNAPGERCDISWMEEGAVAKAAREKEIVQATLVTQSMWHKKCDLHSAFAHLSKPIASQAIQSKINQKQYGAALRNAALHGNLPLLQLLLRWKDKLGIDLYETSTKPKPLNALEWARESTAGNKQHVIEVLEAAMIVEKDNLQMQ